MMNSNCGFITHTQAKRNILWYWLSAWSHWRGIKKCLKMKKISNDNIAQTSREKPVASLLRYLIWEDDEGRRWKILASCEQLRRLGRRTPNRQFHFHSWRYAVQYKPMVGQQPCRLRPPMKSKREALQTGIGCCLSLGVISKQTQAQAGLSSKSTLSQLHPNKYSRPSRNRTMRPQWGPGRGLTS